MPRKQILSGVVLAAAAASSLTGCSLKATDGAPQSFAQLSSLSAPDAIQAADRAVEAHPSAKVHTVLTTPQASESFDVTAAFGDHPALQGTLNTPSGDPSQPSPAVPLRYADNVMYMEMGASSPQMAAQMDGKMWMKMDLAAMAQDPRTASFGTDVLDNTSPSRGLTMLTASKDLHAVGQEQKGGVQTMHYAGALTGADASDPNLVGRGLTQDQADLVSEALAQGQVSKLGYDVWLRADGLPVAMTFTEATPIGTLSGETDYSDWGTSLSVKAVADSDSADYMAMLKQSDAAQAAASSAPSGSASSSAPSTAPSSSATDGSSTPGSTASSSAPAQPSSSDSANPSVPSTPSATSTAGAPTTPTPAGAPSTTAKTPTTPATKPSSTSTASSPAA
jgi:hypothetical protein